MTAYDVSHYLLGVRSLHSDATVLVRFRALRRFFNWAVEEEWLTASPMARMKLPGEEQKLIPVPPADDIRRLLSCCSGRSFEDRRDEAIIRLFCEPGGPRLAEMASVRTADVDLVRDQVALFGKGAKWRQVPFSGKTGKAISRYARMRQGHALAALPGFWLGSREQALTPSGITQVIRRRCRQAGISPAIHPHQFRHYAADAFLGSGGSEQDAMRLFGWDSPEMPRRYGRANAASRAIEASRAMALGDRL
jgi:site-specific recombinase XerC